MIDKNNILEVVLGIILNCLYKKIHFALNSMQNERNKTMFNFSDKIYLIGATYLLFIKSTCSFEYLEAITL